MRLLLLTKHLPLLAVRLHERFLHARFGIFFWSRAFLDSQAGCGHDEVSSKSASHPSLPASNDLLLSKRCGAVLLSSFLGVVMVTWADSSSSDVPPPSTSTAAPINAPLGDALALLSAFCYAVYVTLLKVRIGEEERVSMPLFFGFVGAFNIAAMWPFGLVLHFTGIEPFAWPSNGMTWAGVGVNMAITFVSDMCYLIAMLKSSPLVATIGLSLTIPLAVAGDIARGSHSGGVQADLGALLVLVSALLLPFRLH